MSTFPELMLTRKHVQNTSLQQRADSQGADYSQLVQARSFLWAVQLSDPHGWTPGTNSLLSPPRPGHARRCTVQQPVIPLLLWEGSTQCQRPTLGYHPLLHATAPGRGKGHAGHGYNIVCPQYRSSFLWHMGSSATSNRGTWTVNLRLQGSTQETLQ